MTTYEPRTKSGTARIPIHCYTCLSEGRKQKERNKPIWRVEFSSRSYILDTDILTTRVFGLCDEHRVVEVEIENGLKQYNLNIKAI